MKQLPPEFEWLNKEGAPKVIVEALKHYGTLEHVGVGSNPDITQWAKEIGVGNAYTDDDIPWCGLFVAICVHRAGYDVVSAPLWARNWVHFGFPQRPAMLGDILVFKRGNSGHVGFYVGEDADDYAVLAGNQSNSVSIAWIAKYRMLDIRRCPYHLPPNNIRQIMVKKAGEVSKNEA